MYLVLYTFAIAGSVLLLILLRTVLRLIRTINKVPGPPGRPIIGNLFDIWLSSEELWRRLRSMATEYYPIYKLWAVYVPSFHFLDPDDIEVVLSTSKHTRKSPAYTTLQPWLGTGLLTSSGAKWQKRRKILTPAFHFNILQQFVHVFKEQSELLVARLDGECDKPHTDVIPIVTEYTLRTICETAMGFRLDSQEKNQRDYVSAIYRMGELIVHRVLRPWIYPELTYVLTPQRWEQRKMARILHGFSARVIEERKSSFEPSSGAAEIEEDDVGMKKRSAMLDLLISTQRIDGGIDDEGIREEVDTFMFEGHDTTAMAISFALFSLANDPEVQDKAVKELSGIFGDSDRRATYQDLQDMSYLEMVLKETLRMYPSVPFIARVADEEFTTPSGYVVPAHVELNIHIYDLHHNPRFYPEPDKFRPERFLPENTQKRHPFAYLPFSAGPRNCIGQRFAMLELKSAVSAVLRKFVLKPIYRQCDLSFTTELLIRLKGGLKIRFRRRK